MLRTTSDQETGEPFGPLSASALASERRRRSRLRVPALTILYHPDVRRVGERAALGEILLGREAHLSRTQPTFASPGSAAFRPLEDSALSRRPLRLAAGGELGALRLSAGGSGIQVIADGAAVEEVLELAAARLAQGVVLELAGRVVLLLHTLGAEPPAAAGRERYGMIGDSEAIAEVRQEISRVADLDVPVLLRGETGTGKELAAKAIHEAGRRREGPFVAVNMGAIPPSLATTELFGAVKGAFTGSVRTQQGHFQRAHGGTLFLDEIGEAPPEVQVMLLRALETGEVQRVGSEDVQKVDVRLLAATDADLGEAQRAGRFRAPLFHRLAGYEIVLPPLRERRGDFGRLFVHFLRQELKATGEERRLDPPAAGEEPWLPASIVARLARHDWPGNVRELRNAARQLAIESRGADCLRVGPQLDRLLRNPVRRPEAPAPGPPPPPRRAPAGAYRPPGEVGADELLAALRASRWDLKAAAARLGVSRPSLYVLIERCPGIRTASDLGAAEILECQTHCAGDLDAMAERLEVSRRGLERRMRELGIST